MGRRTEVRETAALQEVPDNRYLEAKHARMLKLLSIDFAALLSLSSGRRHPSRAYEAYRLHYIRDEIARQSGRSTR